MCLTKANSSYLVEMIRIPLFSCSYLWNWTSQTQDITSYSKNVGTSRGVAHIRICGNNTNRILRMYTKARSVWLSVFIQNTVKLRYTIMFTLKKDISWIDNELIYFQFLFKKNKRSILLIKKKKSLVRVVRKI